MAKSVKLDGGSDARVQTYTKEEYEKEQREIQAYVDRQKAK